MTFKSDEGVKSGNENRNAILVKEKYTLFGLEKMFLKFLAHSAALCIIVYYVLADNFRQLFFTSENKIDQSRSNNCHCCGLWYVAKGKKG